MSSSSAATYELEQLLQQIESVPNLRLLCTRSQHCIENSSDRIAVRGALYRSSKPDRITAEDVVLFRKLRIKTIVDFRSLDEYRGSDGLCILDKEYSLHKVVLPKNGFKPGDKVESEFVAACDVRGDEKGKESSQERKHFLINFFTASYVLTAMRRVPWYLMLIGILHLMYDLFKKNKFKTFINFFIQHSINQGGIVGQYKDIINVSGPAICAALKLVSNPDNMPVSINCAHGKDRTGIMSALILICLGMSEDYVVKEYSLSAKGLEPVQHLIHNEMVEKLKLRHDFCTANADTMNQLLVYLKEKYGSVQAYMEHIGFTSEDQQQLRDNLIAFENQDCVLIDSLQNGTSVDLNEINV